MEARLLKSDLLLYLQRGRVSSDLQLSALCALLQLVHRKE